MTKSRDILMPGALNFQLNNLVNSMCHKVTVHNEFLLMVRPEPFRMRSEWISNHSVRYGEVNCFKDPQNGRQKITSGVRMMDLTNHLKAWVLSPLALDK